MEYISNLFKVINLSTLGNCNGLSRNFIEIEEIFAKRNKNAPSTIKMIRLCKELLGKGGSGMVIFELFDPIYLNISDSNISGI